MPRNGSGTYSLPQPPFVTMTPISSSAMNSDLSDIGTAITGSVAADGQTTITGALKGFVGSASAPGYSFSSDLNTGMYRVSADVLGFAAGGSLIASVSATGISITGTFTPTGQILAGNGTDALPIYSFASDPDSGMYRIGANNIGVSVNATKILDISASGLNVIGTVSSNGAVLAPIAQSVIMQNGTLVESHAGNAATFAIKTLAGADPSSGDPVTFIFRNVTAGTGNYTVLQATAAISLTVTSGSTLGATNATPFKPWFVVFNDGGTLRLGIINCLSGLNIYPLGQMPIASATLEGGAGGADSAQVFYANATVTSKAYAIVGYASYETGLTTAGAWDASPTRIQLFGPNVPLPGERIRLIPASSSSYANIGTSTVPLDNTIPQASEMAATDVLTQAVTPTSAANLLSIEGIARLGVGSAANIIAGIFVDAAADALRVAITTNTANATLVVPYVVLAATTSSRTYKLKGGNDSGFNTYANGNSLNALFNGTLASTLSIEEIIT